MSIPSQRKYDAEHVRNLDRYSREIRRAYIALINEVAKLAKNARLSKNLEFYFRTNTKLSKQVDSLLKTLNSNVYGTTVFGIQNEWDLATVKNNELAYWAFGKETLSQVPASVRNKILGGNAGARWAFIRRKDGGLSLSEKIWKNTRQFKQELEWALELGIGQGKSASSLASTLKYYLNDSDKLFRRVRDKSGVLRLSKAAKSYNPGQGRYRSSYKNSLRLARNEINFSYEASQKEKREQQDFIVGIEIRVSPSHNPADDKGGICCLCLQGKYPKDFDFTYKWHVNCKCQSFNILKTREELDKDVDKILAGKEPNTRSKNAVNKKPKAYTTYVKEYKQKKQDSKSALPRTFERN